ncbi:HNH endonuclease [Flammeovirgaceae bacterium SG7u.111]|nr:HNH endonuclease [Flammeovirgaceae bacterium SG7u.132]WPO34758.1 HNH endonuclease [Flammeovirgaceae bacterium SG7u.111]
MGFSRKVKEEVLVSSARHCCVCHRYKGVKIEIHHILPKEQGGEDTFENAIPLCFDCHSDAGHYHAQHPKGTKFSINELKKHKKEWFEIVKKNNIPEKKENRIHARYLITKEFDIIKGISQKDLSGIPITNCIFLENYSLKHFRKIFKNQQYRDLEIKNNLDCTPEAYLSKYPDVEVLQYDENEYPFYHHERMPMVRDVAINCKNDGLTQFLLNNKVPPEKISKILTYTEAGGCGDHNGSFGELYLLKPVYFKFLVVTNISNAHIKLKELICKSYNGILYHAESINSENAIHFPPILIEPNQSVVIPLGMFLTEFDDLEKADDFIRFNEIKGDRSIVLDHTSASKDEEIEYLGMNYFPLKINYEIDENQEYEDIHDFDFSNLYWIDGYWNCGSCPHLFFQKNNGDLLYQGEIFNTIPDIMHYHRIKIKHDISKIIIAELEHEKTVIQEIKINGITKISNLTLNHGEELSLEISFNDIFEVKGYYSIFSKKNAILPIHKKFNIVRRYKNNNSLTS